MAIRRPGETRYDPYTSQHFLSVATSSSSRSNSPPSPNPPRSEAIDPIFASYDPYAISYTTPYFEPYPLQQPPQSTQPNFVSPQELHLAYQQLQSVGYLNVNPPADFGGMQAFSMTPSYEPVKQEPIPLQQEQTFLLNEELRPISGSLTSVELPKRKGDRALARLHRSVRQTPTVSAFLPFTISKMM